MEMTKTDLLLSVKGNRKLCHPKTIRVWYCWYVDIDRSSIRGLFLNVVNLV
jgi:hypothetical protein